MPKEPTHIENLRSSVESHGRALLHDIYINFILPLQKCALQILESSHQQSITSVLYNLGMIVTASKDGQVLLHSPGGSHDLLCTLEQRTSAPTGLDFSRNTLAVAGGDRNVSLWTHSITGSIV